MRRACTNHACVSSAQRQVERGGSGTRTMSPARSSITSTPSSRKTKRSSTDGAGSVCHVARAAARATSLDQLTCCFSDGSTPSTSKGEPREESEASCWRRVGVQLACRANWGNPGGQLYFYGTVAARDSIVLGLTRHDNNRYSSTTCVSVAQVCTLKYKLKQKKPVWSMPLCRVLWFSSNKLLSQKNKKKAIKP